jgi:hypothetical protein
MRSIDVASVRRKIWAGKAGCAASKALEGLQGALHGIEKEITMKRVIQVLVLATLVTTAQASPFPADGELVPLAAQSTYADRHAGNMQGGNWSASEGELVALPAQSTYADRHANEASRTGSAFPGGDGELVALPSQSTYADRFAMEAGADRQAALSE